MSVATESRTFAELVKSLHPNQYERRKRIPSCFIFAAMKNDYRQQKSPLLA